ncbi:hypothetical protein AVEN_130216-1 [Araneus ventricosus]|uniref:Uncharacterized protein n=1 Tax=Araneus ventricosus TaxID=182803 RepID=A0A4Y2GD65_ARAVE|nr:hypothetical protein AVEN_130216-1 [Araneus ventricosus]
MLQKDNPCKVYKRKSDKRAFEKWPGGKSFLKNEELVVTVFEEGIGNLVHRYDKCLNLHGDYVQRCLAEKGLYVQRSVVDVAEEIPFFTEPGTPSYYSTRLDHVPLADESWFNIQIPSRRISIWRKCGVLYHSSHIKGINRIGGSGILLSGGIVFECHTPLSDSVLQLTKNVTIKDVIYWVSESWNNVTQNCLLKWWKKLWPNLADSIKVEQGEANKSEILPLIKCIPDCKEATEHTVTEWLSCATEANQLYTDEEIISLVQNKPQDDSDLEETDEPENVLVSHSEAANALEIALHS